MTGSLSLPLPHPSSPSPLFLFPALPHPLSLTLSPSHPLSPLPLSLSPSFPLPLFLLRSLTSLLAPSIPTAPPLPPPPLLISPIPARLDKRLERQRREPVPLAQAIWQRTKHLKCLKCLKCVLRPRAGDPAAPPPLGTVIRPRRRHGVQTDPVYKLVGVGVLCLVFFCVPRVTMLANRCASTFACW